jgi:uncharacterized protein
MRPEFVAERGSGFVLDQKEDFNPMIYPRWLVAIPLVLAASFVLTPAQASSVRDHAHLFSSEAVEKAQAQLDQLERSTHIPVVIETIEKVPGLDRKASTEEKHEAINALAVRKDNAIKDEGIYYLISKNDRVNSNILVRERFKRLLPDSTRTKIGAAFLAQFKKGDFDGGLLHGVQAIERALEGASIGHKAAQAPGGIPLAARHQGGQSTMGTFFLIMLGIFGVLLVLRLLGGLFGRSAGAGYPGQMGGMPRPGMGGYGAPGYGGGGGGFFSGMLGGLGGALAGNWLYDQFSGRHGGMNSADAMHSADYGAGGADQGGDAIVGADDNPVGGNSWDDAGTGDTGGGDWGGGGGDWGGGGGDWGGGGGGGDW